MVRAGQGERGRAGVNCCPGELSLDLSQRERSICVADRVRGWALSIDRNPSPQPSPTGRGGRARDAAAFGADLRWPRLLQLSHAPSCDSFPPGFFRARAAFDRAAGGGYRCGHASRRRGRCDGAGGAAPGDRGISPQAQGIPAGARSVLTTGQGLLEFDRREAAGPQRQAARASSRRAR